MEGIEIDTRDEAEKSRVAIRCAKVAIMLSSLRNHNHLKTTSSINGGEEKEMMEKSIGDLKMELARERMKRKKIKLCGLMEIVLQVTLVLSIVSFFFMLAMNSR